MTKFCKKFAILQSNLTTKMEMDEKENVVPGPREASESGDAAEEKEEAPSKLEFTEPELVARGILWDIFRQATRWDGAYDFKVDPNAAPERNVFDTHCHLDKTLFGQVWRHDLPFEEFKKIHGKYYDKFEGCITIFMDLAGLHTNPNRKPDMKKLLAGKGVYGAVGCHPNHAHIHKDYAIEVARSVVGHPKMVAIGEVGIDLSYRNLSGTRPPPHKIRTQMTVFRDFVELALEWRKPLILHVREATGEAMQVMTEAGLPHFWPIHLHCFNEGWQTCQTWMEAYPNMKFGFVLPLLDDVVTRIPLERMLLETDAPFFPVNEAKLRDWVNLRSNGRLKSHPGQVFFVASKIAKMRGIEVGDVLKANRDNVRALYGI